MRRPVGWGERAGWSLLGGLACLLPAAAAHAAAGGALPRPGLLLLMLAVLSVPGAVLAGAGVRRRFETAVVVLAVLQLALHESFHRLAPHTATMTMTMPDGTSHDLGMAGMAGMAGMTGMAGMPGMHDMPGMAGAGAAGAAVHAMHGSMAAWHAVATLTSAAALLHGSRLVRRLVTLLAAPRLPLLVALFAVPALPVPPRPVRSEPTRPALGVLLARSLPRRGPPPARA
ncbi:hypothetical protein ACIRBX_24190 [Kitasatospora sp. NPDC096147]|uniref:hypothetical protein n=1 Tax=Kitasatospora sp. NPDC096147 TaxID=3364093 RepID=UPI0037F7BB99